MPSLHSNRGAKRAREARTALGLAATAAIEDLLEVVEHRGEAFVVVLDLADVIAGAYAARPDCPMIFVNGRQPVARQRFTLAHEFGHHRLGHESVVDRTVTIGGYQHDPVEVEANAFAAEFLMPKAGVVEWADASIAGAVTLEDVVRLAYAFGVSAQAARYALETAGVLTDEQRGVQLDGEIADDLHAEIGPRLGLTPIEDSLSAALGHLPRIPKELAGSVLGDLLVGEIDVAEMAGRLDSSVAEVEKMLDGFGLSRLLPLSS